jgi:hypothetical protein
MTRPDARALIQRLPATFRPALNEQLSNWDVLFPAEQRTLAAQLDWLAGLPPDEFQRLFAPIVEIEAKMDLPHWSPGAAGLTVQDTGRLARSPLYPQWREAVEKVFSQVDEAIGKSGRLRRTRRLVICVLPPGLPIAGQALWPEIAKHGSWVALDRPFDRLLPPLTVALAGRPLAPGIESIEATWVLQCDSRLATPGATILGWDSLAAVRREFLSRLNTIRRDLGSVDKTNDQLRKMDLGRLLDDAAAWPPQVREFVRSLFLSGNGSLVFNNSFVQWGASETLRRVEPQVLLACFGIRQKLKPFSSVVLFEDQHRANPVKDETDPAGSLVDAMILADYVYRSARRMAAPGALPLTLMAACDLDRLLVLGPNVPVAAAGSLTLEELTGFALRWLAG